MKSLFFVLAILLFVPSLSNAVILDYKENFVVASTALDSTGIDTQPDSVRVIVYNQLGAEEIDIWYETADDEVSAQNGQLVFDASLFDLSISQNADNLFLAFGFFDDGDSLYTWLNMFIQMADTSTAGQPSRSWVGTTISTTFNYGAANVDSVNAVVDSLNLIMSDIAILNDITAIEVWDVPFAAAFNPGSMGDSLNNATYVQGMSSASASVIADSVAGRFGSVGTQLDTLVVVDTSGADAVVTGVNIRIENASNVFQTSGTTSGTGRYQFGNLSGNHIIVPFKTGYVFTPVAPTINLDGTALDTVYCYDATTSAKELRIFGYIEEFGAPIGYADIIYSLGGTGAVYDTTGSKNTYQSKRDNFATYDTSIGYFYFDVIESSRLFDERGNHPKYNVTIRDNYGNLILRRRQFTAYVGEDTLLTQILD